MQFPSYIFLDKFMFLMTFLECTWKKTGQIWTDTLNFLFCYEIYFQKREKHNQEQVYITIITINNKYLHNYQSFSFYLNCPIFAPTVQICPCPDLPLGTVVFGMLNNCKVEIILRPAPLQYQGANLDRGKSGQSGQISDS